MMESHYEEEIPKKRRRTVKNSLRSCVICNIKAPETELTKPRDGESWMKLLQAGISQKCVAICQYKDFPEIPEILYHLNCRKAFTHKKTLEHIEQLEQGPDMKPPSCQEYEPRISVRNTIKASTTSRIYETICIFCEGTKYKRKSHTRERLLKAVDLRSDKTLRLTAEMKMDEKMLAITSRDIVAAEAHYHHTCYLNYTRESKNHKDKEDDDDQEYYENYEKEAYNMLYSFICKDLFAQPRIEPMVNLTEKLVENMKSLGVTDIKVHTKNHIRRNLEIEFGDSIEIIVDEAGKLLVIPDNLSRCMLIKQIQRIEAELHSLRSRDQGEVLKGCALGLRREIKASQIDQPWPSKPDMLDNNYAPIPESLTNFLKVLLTGDTQMNSISRRVELLVQSFSQDYIYAISSGKVKTAKHIQLPWTVKSLTGNVELIMTLNRLGHGISYSQLQEIDTALCLMKLEDQDSSGVIIPSNIVPCIPATLAYDNIDRLEETLSGSGTSHRVNGIIVQPEVPTVERHSDAKSKAKDKRRSIDPPMTQLPLYNAGTRTGPAVKETMDMDYTNSVDKVNSHLKNYIWSLIRQTDPENQKVSSWTGFNILIRSDSNVTKDKVGYLPTINAPATDMSTVYEIMNQALMIKEKLKLMGITCVFDQALYAKAAEVVWKHSDKFHGIVLRMGVFHTLCNLFSIIGKRFHDAGLKDLAVESGLIAAGSINGVLEGRMYNRAVRLHKLVYEALLRIAWKGFPTWIEETHIADLPKLNDATLQAEKLHSNLTPAQLIDLQSHPSCIRIFALFNDYLNFLRHNNGSLSSFWMSYIDIVEVALGLIRASREGNWSLHLAIIRAIIPWTFAYDRQNYARYLPVYYGDMIRLENEHPDVYHHLQNGGFSVQMGSINPFGRIPVDQAIEESANKDTQTPGGTKGFNLKPGAVLKYYVTAEYRSTCVRNLRQMVQINKTPGICHIDLEASRIKRDEHDVESLQQLLEDTWINPFGEPNELVCLSTGAVAAAEVKGDLLKAQEKGEDAYKSFKQNRLEQMPPPQQFHERLPKLKLKTFSDMQKSTRTKASNKEIMLKADHKLFGHMILVAASRQLDMQLVLKHPLGPLPWALANIDGTMKKTNKAALARYLENRVSPADTIPGPSACIIDGMALVHKVHAEGKKFSELAGALFTSVLKEGYHGDRIDVVFDVYKDESIKNAEREKRSLVPGLLLNNITAEQKILKWRAILGCSGAKTALIKFFCDEWKKPYYLDKLGCKVMFITCQEKCTKLTRTMVTDVPELKSTQEEADTRILLHAKHASYNHEAVIVVSEDTDVFILALAFNTEIPNMYVKCGTQTRVRYVDIGKLATALGDELCKSLIGLHAFTGCDSVSAFAGRGKLSALKIISKSESLTKALMDIGSQWDLTAEMFVALQELTCRVYVTGTDIADVNDLRYQLFRSKKGDIESCHLPPCEDCLHLHAQRANYQAAVWRRSLEQYPVIPNPEAGYGWTIEEGRLAIKWMQGKPAPEVVLEFMACKCPTECKLPHCECLTNGLHCTPACRLQTCKNMPPEIDEDVVGTVEGISDDEDDNN